MSDYGIQLRQPAAGDLIGRTVAIAAIGTAFEATYGWRLLGGGSVVSEGFFTAGSMGLLESFVHSAETATGYVGPATFQLFGEDASGEHPPGTDLQERAVVVIGPMRGYVVHQVVRGDTLSAIARDLGSRVPWIVAANGIPNPDLIRVGQVLRVPVEG
jgi:nucleoid-associated protein YgaU